MKVAEASSGALPLVADHHLPETDLEKACLREYMTAQGARAAAVDAAVQAAAEAKQQKLEHAARLARRQLRAEREAVAEVKAHVGEAPYHIAVALYSQPVAPRTQHDSPGQGGV